ncbi:MAG: sulfurtransferase TusA family protein [Planctomycetaceae bacterium]|jgi:tRNA 2-thiouridine synthesizing protein A
MATAELDCRGLSCPMPIVKLSRAMKGLELGDELTIVASDPSFQPDLEAWVRKMGHQLKSFVVAGDVQTAVVAKLQ